MLIIRRADPSSTSTALEFIHAANQDMYRQIPFDWNEQISKDAEMLEQYNAAKATGEGVRTEAKHLAHEHSSMSDEKRLNMVSVFDALVLPTVPLSCLKLLQQTRAFIRESTKSRQDISLAEITGTWADMGDQDDEDKARLADWPSPELGQDDSWLCKTLPRLTEDGRPDEDGLLETIREHAANICEIMKSKPKIPENSNWEDIRSRWHSHSAAVELGIRAGDKGIWDRVLTLEGAREVQAVMSSAIALQHVEKCLKDFGISEKSKVELDEILKPIKKRGDVNMETLETFTEMCHIPMGETAMQNKDPKDPRYRMLCLLVDRLSSAEVLSVSSDDVSSKGDDTSSKSKMNVGREAVGGRMVELGIEDEAMRCLFEKREICFEALANGSILPKEESDPNDSVLAAAHESRTRLLNRATLMTRVLFEVHGSPLGSSITPSEAFNMIRDNQEIRLRPVNHPLGISSALWSTAEDKDWPSIKNKLIAAIDGAYPDDDETRALFSTDDPVDVGHMLERVAKQKKDLSERISSMPFRYWESDQASLKSKKNKNKKKKGENDGSAPCRYVQTLTDYQELVSSRRDEHSASSSEMLTPMSGESDVDSTNRMTKCVPEGGWIFDANRESTWLSRFDISFVAQDDDDDNSVTSFEGCSPTNIATHLPKYFPATRINPNSLQFFAAEAM